MSRRVESKYRFIFDADASVTLRGPLAVALTATGADAAVDLGVNKDAYWSDKKLPDEVYYVAFNVSAADRTTGDETYSLALQLCSDAAGANPVTVAVLPAITAPGIYVLPVDARTAEAIYGTANVPTHARVNATLAGTTPILSYTAYLVEDR